MRILANTLIFDFFELLVAQSNGLKILNRGQRKFLKTSYIYFLHIKNCSDRIENNFQQDK